MGRLAATLTRLTEDTRCPANEDDVIPAGVETAAMATFMVAAAILRLEWKCETRFESDWNVKRNV